MNVLFIHGWSVTDTGTYGLLPEAIATRAPEFDLDITIEHIWLGRYISFHDEVSITDIARALEAALRETFVVAEDMPLPHFSCITHSTGGPVVRAWIQRYYGHAALADIPLKHFIMLSPANHGSPLAVLGKARVGRIKAWFSNIEPGVRILQWLSLGSLGQEQLATDFIRYNGHRAGFYPFVLTGQSIDHRFYDFLNGYLKEAGSDGVVRVANANMSYGMVRLVETDRQRTADHGGEPVRIFELDVDDAGVQVPEPVPLGVVPETSHTGQSIGMMGSIDTPDAYTKPQVTEILHCLRVADEMDYATRGAELAQLTAATQQESDQYAQLVFIVRDDEGDPVLDFDLFLLGGAEGRPDQLTSGFFMDRQRNVETPNHLVYYVNHTVLSRDRLTGFRLVARPQTGLSHYHTVEYCPQDVDLHSFVKPNETFYVEIQLTRHVDKAVFQFDGATDHPYDSGSGGTRLDFKATQPSGDDVP